jgi:hypothetical protein
MPADSDKLKAGRMLRGARWVPLLKEARLGKAFSIFLAEAVTSADLRALDRVINAPPPKPGTNVDVSHNRAAALERLAASIADGMRVVYPRSPSRCSGRRLRGGC